eukprot:764716-Hanusia_phi.AAC.1
MVFNFDLSIFYDKLYPECNIVGEVTYAYVLNSPDTRPRDGIYNMMYQDGATDFTYLATIKDDMLTVYPDHRGVSYVLETKLWLDGYSNSDWILTNSTFVVSELSKSIHDVSYFADLNINPRDIDLYSIYPVSYDINSDLYHITTNPYDSLFISANMLEVIPDCRGGVGIESGETLIDGVQYYGSNLVYNIKVNFYTNISFEFKVTEQPPFYVKPTYYDSSILDLHFDSDTPHIIDPIKPYLLTYTGLSFVYDCNLPLILDDLGMSKYPIDGHIRPAAVLDAATGEVVLYPAYRNTRYDIIIDIYLEGFPNKHLTSIYSVSEADIPPT